VWEWDGSCSFWPLLKGRVHPDSHYKYNHTMTNASATVPTFLERLTSYPLVKYSCETTLHFYNEAKEKNNYVKRGLELAETSVGTVATSPLVLNVSKSCEPLLAKADQFGCNQLDRAEVSIFKPAVQLYTTANATLASSKKIVEEKVADSKKLVTEKVVQPISSTYQHLVALPTVLTNQVFDFAQDSVDYYLPEEAESEKDASLVQAEEAVPLPQEANNNAIKTKSVWARSSTLTQCAYRRVQRKASHRVRIARLYGESVLTKSPLAVSVVNYVRTRDPEIRNNLVKQAKATVTYYTDKTKGFVAERPLFKQATAFVEPYLANLSYQSFYSLLLTLLATVTTIKSTKQPSTTATSASSSSASAETQSAEEEGNTDGTDGIDEQEEIGDEETSGPAEPASDEEEEEAGEENSALGEEQNNVDDDDLAEDVAEHDERPQANDDEHTDGDDVDDDEVTVDY